MKLGHVKRNWRRRFFTLNNDTLKARAARTSRPHAQGRALCMLGAPGRRAAWAVSGDRRGSWTSRGAGCARARQYFATEQEKMYGKPK